MFTKILIGSLLVSNGFFFISPVWSEENTQESTQKSTVIINNEATATSPNQAITAPALVPSEAIKLRDVRKEQEIKTEDTLMKELEKHRLVDEQKRVDKIMGNTSQETPIVAPPVQLLVSEDDRVFGKKSFVSLGLGFVTFPFTDVSSLESPAYFFSFGGYGYKGHLIVDLSLYYSKHYLWWEEKGTEFLKALDQPAFSMSVKISPFSGQMKPYIGVSGSLNFRKWSIEEPEEYREKGEKRWHQSFDAGVVVGADIALGEHLGLNADVRYYWNLDTENRKTIEDVLQDREIVDKQDSLILSLNLRYYL